MPDLFWNLLSLAGLCFFLVILFCGITGVDIPDEAKDQD